MILSHASSLEAWSLRHRIGRKGGSAKDPRFLGNWIQILEADSCLTCNESVLLRAWRQLVCCFFSLFACFFDCCCRRRRELMHELLQLQARKTADHKCWQDLLPLSSFSEGEERPGCQD